MDVSWIGTVTYQGDSGHGKEGVHLVEVRYPEPYGNKV